MASHISPRVTRRQRESVRRRTGEPLLVVTHVAQRSDSTHRSSDDSSRSIDATWHGDTLTGVLLRDGKPAGQRYSPRAPVNAFRR